MSTTYSNRKSAGVGLAILITRYRFMKRRVIEQCDVWDFGTLFIAFSNQDRTAFASIFVE